MVRAAESPLSVAFRNMQPSWRNYVEYAEIAANAGDAEMVKFMAAYNGLPRNEQLASMPERICDLAGVAPGALVGSVSREYWTHSQGESAITVAANHARMVQATAFWGQTQAENNKDRELFFRVAGTLKDNKGTSILINNNPQTATFNPALPAGPSGFLPMDQRVINMGKILEAPVEAVPLFVKEPALRVFSPDDSNKT